MRNEVSARGAGNFYDLSVLEKPPVVHERSERMDDIVRESREVENIAHGLLEGQDEEMPQGDEGPAAPVLNLGAPEVRHEDPRDNEPETESPTKRLRVTQPLSQLNQALRGNVELLDRGVAATSSTHGRSLAETTPVPDDEGEEELEVTLSSGCDRWVVDHERSLLIRTHEGERDSDLTLSKDDLPVREQDVEEVCQSVRFDRSGNRTVVDYEWRAGKGGVRRNGVKWTGRTVFTLRPGWQWKREHGDCFEVGVAKKGRKELNEKEIDEGRKEGLRKAKLKEWNKLLQSGAIVVHKGKEAERLRSSVPRRRVLKSRFVLTEADEGSSPNTSDIKARWCIRGYLDPDLLELDTSAPTLSAEGFSIAMQLMTTFGWKLTIADVEGAFLRGDDLSPDRGRLFIDLPPGGIDGYDESCLVEAVKTVYGLADAPKAWWNCLDKKLTSLGMRASKFDPCVYYYYYNNKISGVIALHVDDLCMGGNQYFQQHVQAKLREMFPFKHWKTGSGEFLGKWLEQQKDGSIKISQEQYASSLQSVVIKQERRREKDQKLTEQEKGEMRAALGGINWLVTSSRPDLAAWCSLLQQKVNAACVCDLIEVNKLISLARDYSRSYVWVKPIPVANMQFCVLTDAAWANATGFCSQAGYMVAGCDERLANGQWGTFSILRWKSFKQDRQTHSTLGAELLALSRGLAEARWIRSMWCEAVYHDYTLDDDGKWSNAIPLTAVIDCKPVYDHAGSSTVSLKDKRMAIEMLLLKRDIQQYGIKLRWMATSQMIVDVLTKKGAPMNLFRKVLREGSFILVEDEAVKSVTSKRSDTFVHVNPRM